VDGKDAEFVEAELQTMEHELLGFYITSHPLHPVRNRLNWLVTHAIRDLKGLNDGTPVIIGGLATQIEKKLTKQNKLLSVIRLEDLGGEIEVVAYSEVLDRTPNDVLNPQSLILVKGKTKKNEDSISVLATSMRKMSDAAIVSIFMDDQAYLEDQSKLFAALHRLREILITSRGDDPVLLNFPRGKQNQIFLTGSQFRVDASCDLKGAISTSLGNLFKVSVNKVQI